MKTNPLIALVLFFFFGCTNQISTRMTSQQQEIAKKEIGEVVKGIFQNLEKKDADALFQSYSNSSDFVFFTTDGSMVDLQEAKNHHSAWFKSLSSLTVTTTKDNFIFLPGNDVICSWLGRFEMTLGSGEQLKINKFGITFIFRKIDYTWKVIYQHSSALPPVQDMPAK
jgi:ketosteroid isomerase-like protein